MESNNLIIIGKARNTNIKRTCINCNKKFLIDTKEYIKNIHGVILSRPYKEEWICNECYDKILKIKNMI